MTVRVPAACINCLHWRGFGTCAAYPDAVPGDILDDHVPHESLRGDEQVALTFELDPEQAEAEEARRGLLGLLESSPMESAPTAEA